MPYSVALGRAATANAANSVALGSHSWADRPQTVSVGTAGNEASRTLLRQLVNVGDPTEPTDATNLRSVVALIQKMLAEHCGDGHCESLQTTR